MVDDLITYGREVENRQTLTRDMIRQKLDSFAVNELYGDVIITFRKGRIEKLNINQSVLAID